MVGEEVEREEHAINKEFICGEEIGLRAGGVPDHPELELGRVGVGAGSSSSTAAPREGLWFEFEAFFH